MNSASDNLTSVGLLLLLSIGIIVVLAIALAWRWRSEVVRVLPSLLLTLAVVLFVFFGLKWSRGVATQTALQHEAARDAELQMTQRVLSSRATESASAPVVAELDSAKPDVEQPEWTRQPARVDGSRKLIVVRSGRFSSEEEAVFHGFQQAAVTAVKENASLDPRGVGALQPQHTDMVKETAIKQRHLETIAEYDFGKFKAPMYQLWLQVELSPELGERLAEPWRQMAVAARLEKLTGWSVWGTAAAALAAFALRLDAAWNGRRRAVVAGTAIALSLGSLAFLV